MNCLRRCWSSPRYFMKCDLSCLCILAEFCHILFCVYPRRIKPSSVYIGLIVKKKRKRVLSDMNSKWTFLINDKHVAIMFFFLWKYWWDFQFKMTVFLCLLQFYSNHTFYTIFTPHGSISFPYSTPFHCNKSDSFLKMTYPQV